VTPERGLAVRPAQCGWIHFRWIACWHRLLAFLGLLFFLAHPVHAGPPVLEGLFPAGAQRGTSTLVHAIGKFDTWPPNIWVSTPGVAFVAQTNKGRFSVAITSEAAPGPCLVRFYNADGASEPRIFVVDSGPVIADEEPNNHFAKPQTLRKLPCTIDGRLDKNGDVDSFSIEMESGQWLETEVDAYVLMSKVDVALRLVTTNGVQLAWNHDFITLDPRLTWQAASNQTVVLQVFGFAYPPGSDIRLAGGETAIYRLHLRALQSPPDGCGRLGRDGENGETSDSQLPLSIRGQISSASEEDRFKFEASKGDSIEARVEAAAIGSPLDAWLKIEDAAGNELARNDDEEGSRDPRLEWRAATNGTFFIVIGSATHRGGEEFCYRLSVQRAKPDFHASLSASSLSLTTGATNELKIDVKRLRGHTNELIARVRGLPPCVTAAVTKLPQKDGAGVIRFESREGACEFQGPVHVLIAEAATGEERVIPFKLTTRGEAPYTRLFVESCDELWLTVGAKPPEAKATADKK
jgi:hypothetical protein